MSKFFYFLTALMLVFCSAVWAQDDDADVHSFAPKFFAFQNGVSFGSFDEEAATLKELSQKKGTFYFIDAAGLVCYIGRSEKGDILEWH